MAGAANHKLGPFLNPKLYLERSENNRFNSRHDARKIREGRAVAVMVRTDAPAVYGACRYDS